jgi:hypothetical protein
MFIMVLLIEGNLVFKAVKTLLRKGEIGVYFCPMDKEILIKQQRLIWLYSTLPGVCGLQVKHLNVE